MTAQGTFKSTLDTALECVARGWHVFPAKIEGSTKSSYKSAKYSDGRNWGATTDPEEVRRDWSRWPEALLGIVTGPKSDLFVVEADTLKEHGVDGISNLEALLRDNGDIPATIEATSPTGSRHLYFRYPEGAEIKNSASKVAPGIDVRGDGGMVIAPPSYRADKGGAYVWRNPPGFFDVGECPAWLLNKVIKCEPVEEVAPQIGIRIDTGGSMPDTQSADLDEVAELLSYIDPDAGGYQPWCQVLMALHDKTTGGSDGLALAESWSARGDKYSPGEVAAKWKSFKPGGGIGVGTIAELARSGGADLSEIARRHRGRSSAPAAISLPAASSAPSTVNERKSQFYSAAVLKGTPVPPREWLVHGLVPQKTVTLFGGDGGTGKSLLALQLAVAVAGQTKWIGKVADTGRVIFLSAEDDDDELHRRTDDILKAEGRTYDDIKGLTLRSLAGEDALLAVEGQINLIRSELFKELDARAA